MIREKAEEIVNDLITTSIGTHFIRYEICGSIRRKKPEVNDIDIVAIKKDESLYNFGEWSLDDTIQYLDPKGLEESKQLGKRGAERFLLGDKIKRFRYKDIMIDLYLANERTFETLILIRTGSKEHNVRLTTLAIGKGMKLKASGEGLVDRENEKMVYEDTENGILMRLLGRIPPPEKRD